MEKLSYVINSAMRKNIIEFFPKCIEKNLYVLTFALGSFPTGQRNIKLTMHRCTVNSTPIPIEKISVTAGIALSLIPARPRKPYSSTAVIANTAT